MALILRIRGAIFWDGRYVGLLVGGDECVYICVCAIAV